MIKDSKPTVIIRKAIETIRRRVPNPPSESSPLYLRIPIMAEKTKAIVNNSVMENTVLHHQTWTSLLLSTTANTAPTDITTTIMSVVAQIGIGGSFPSISKVGA